jgi:hypothetical protein
MTMLRDDRVTAPAPALESLQRTGRLRRAAASLLKLCGLILLTAAALGLASGLVGEHAASTERAGAPVTEASAWVAVHRPFQFYTLVGTDFARLPMTYTARRHAVGGGRIDMLTYGDVGGHGAFLALLIYRLGREAGPRVAFSFDLAQAVASHGAVLSMSRMPTPLATRFGAFEAADLQIVADGRVTPCLGFRDASAAGAPDGTMFEMSGVLRISGFACGGFERPFGRDALGCVIDRLDIEAAGEDVALQRIFVAAERRRGAPCSPPLRSGTGAKSLWLDTSNAPPPLKLVDR